jgi:molybdopterin-guanine dinucleotide biosynthesis protein A
MRFTAIILAGGKSSRMGQDKGLSFYRGRRMVEFVVEACKKLTSDIFISTNNPEYRFLGYELIEDNFKEIGPIG